MNSEFSLEICVESLRSASAAIQGGATELELCHSLSEGGTTPSAALIRHAVRLSIPVTVLIRPRRGDFLYSEEDFAVMLDDIQFCRESGARGVSVGVLRSDGSIDEVRMKMILDIANPMDVTFHRAFDMTRELDRSLLTLASLGVKRVLTSGGMTSAEAGVERIASLTRLSNEVGGPKVVAAAGVSPSNVTLFLRHGIYHLHSSASKVVPSSMAHQNLNPTMSGAGAGEREEKRKEEKRGTLSEFELKVTCPEIVRSMVLQCQTHIHTHKLM